MGTKIKVGLIGAGWISSCHVKGYRALGDRVEILAIADANQERAEKLRAATGAKHVFGNCRDLLELAEIDAVDIMLPTFLHAEAAISACRKGKHVLCEKPFASTGRECAQMAAAARKAKVLLMPFHNLVFFPSILKAYDVLQKGEIGRPVIYRAKHIFGYPGGSMKFLENNYRGDRRKSGGGAIMEGGAHSIYLAERLMGRIARVSAKLTRFPSGKFEIENGGVVLFEFANGAVGTMTVYWGAGYGDDGKEIIGTKGALIVNGMEYQSLRKPPLGIYRDPKALGHHTSDASQSWEFPYIDFDWEKSFVNTIVHFIDCIQNHKKAIINAEDGKSVIKVVEAIYLSARQGKCVRV
ncbi:MAG: Gfo/Idh/MocA family oxidoreductase [Kiritimatiellae bacterium]|nr:Gfo/Idh/MocA family oxidoreductase [Kiritimatiellia bacterium]